MENILLRHLKGYERVELRHIMEMCCEGRKLFELSQDLFSHLVQNVWLLRPNS